MSNAYERRRQGLCPYCGSDDYEMVTVAGSANQPTTIEECADCGQRFETRSPQAPPFGTDYGPNDSGEEDGRET